MTNPFSRFLRQWSDDSNLHTFVTYWDALEMTVVQVYRQKMTPAAAQPEFERIWPWLRRHYRSWEPQLRPLWRQTRAAGRQTELDPFQLLLDMQNPADIVDNWHAMQHLPAAREALNKLIIADA